MNKKGLAILMRTRMKPTNFSLSPVTNKMSANSEGNEPRKPISANDGYPKFDHKLNSPEIHERGIELVRERMHSAISMNKTELQDNVLSDFSEGYYGLSIEDRRELLMVLAKEYDLNRTYVRDLMKQYLGLQLPAGDKCEIGVEDDGSLSTFYRTEKHLRHALQPTYEVLFERLNTHPGGLKFLSVLRADILSTIKEHNIPSLRALDSYLKEKLITWLSPAALELHHITWDDPASLLEKIVAYEAVHPISSLLDLKRRLGVGRRCFGYLHPAIPGEPLIFIEVALLKNVAQTIQEVLWDDPPILECEATCALFYSISSSQPGLAGINLGKFLIKRVIELVKQDMPHICTFATLSPIPGFMSWLISKLASQSKLAEAETIDMSGSSKESTGSTFREDVLTAEEEREVLDKLGESTSGKTGIEVILNLLKSPNHAWSKSDRVLSVLKPILMRLCARYLLQEKKRGKALDAVANFHLQNGAMVERLNWMADRSEKGLSQSGGIMVNYMYRLDNIEENAQSYFSSGHVNAASDLWRLVE
ncbi:malonyl-CoA decarboxylase, mitochondrial-like isoform X2 [Chenopodium quinoa]|uniref:malonyl-CoA decarboxylase, mitochondrial-like isoform X2 n=1 Tax=Chenopodium quinoa TaxID=63459 RepID=UPI000B77AA41|nr:malonyl-CoA decarboxylase, mitochondrial-like isoform X2 [Chenopodium quinoa]